MKNLKEKTTGFLKNWSQKADEKLMLSGQRDVDEFFEKERGFLDEYYNRIREATNRSDKMCKNYKGRIPGFLTLLNSFSVVYELELGFLFWKFSGNFVSKSVVIKFVLLSCSGLGLVHWCVGQCGQVGHGGQYWAGRIFHQTFRLCRTFSQGGESSAIGLGLETERHFALLLARHRGG